MRLLLTNSIGKNKWGGGEKWMILAAKGLIDRGHQVIIGCHKNSILEHKAKVENIPTEVVSIKTDFSLKGYHQLKRIIKQYNINVVIGCQNKDVRIAGWVARQLGGITVLSRQGVQLLHNSLKYKFTFQPFCDGIITNTNSIKKEYDSYGWWNEDYVKVIYNGIDVPSNTSSSFDFNQYIENKEQKPTIVLSTGRLTNQKGFKYLIEAAKDIVPHYPNTHFFIAGKGKLEKELKKQAHTYALDKNVHFLGFQDDVSALLKGADLFVLPSLYEGMPNSVMEALANGLPVVCTNVNGVGELMHNEQHGIVVPPTDSEALKNSIIKLIKGNGLVALGQNGKKHVEENFSIKKMVDQLEAHLLNKMKTQREFTKTKKFLIIQTAFIGDVILATPIIEKLKRFYPSSSIDVLVRKGNEGLLENNPKINKVVIFDKKNGKYKNLIRLIKSIRKEQYDTVINVQRYMTTGLITALSKAPYKIGFDKNPMSRYFTLAVPHKMSAKEGSDHEVNRNLYLIQSLTDDSFEMPKMYPSATDFEKVKCDGEYYCFAPTSVWFTKQYPAEKWVELLNNLPETAHLFLLGGPGDRNACQAIADVSTHPNIKNLAGELSFLESAALMKGARMNFVNDSAPLHICSAVNAPVRAMFCSTVPSFGYTPLSDNSKVLEVEKQLECRPCGLHGKKTCPLGHFKCGDIPVNTILHSL